MGRLRALRDLAAALRGEPRAGCDWQAVVSLANHGLVTPQLAAALADRGGPPGEIGEFLDEVLSRNRERNARLWRQLMDALQALNAAGVVPLALKGAAVWLWSGDSRDRLSSDLDLLVEPEQQEAALEALNRAGFATVTRRQDPLMHVTAELGRPQDVGLIDLHHRPPGPPGVSQAVGAASRSRCREIEVEGRRVRVPDPAVQILHTVLHDQFRDGDFWRGGLDLRHCLDLAHLAQGVSEEDWRWLREACSTSLGRSALDAQLHAAEWFSGVQIAPTRGRGVWTHRRWLVQFAHPALRTPLAALAIAAGWVQLRDHLRTEARLRRRLIPAAPIGQFASRVQRFIEVMEVRPGKV